jgi:hypothetical protein
VKVEEELNEETKIPFLSCPVLLFSFPFFLDQRLLGHHFFKNIFSKIIAIDKCVLLGGLPILGFDFGFLLLSSSLRMDKFRSKHLNLSSVPTSGVDTEIGLKNFFIRFKL